MKDFEEWWETANYWGDLKEPVDFAKAAWDQQQQRIDDLEAIVKSAYMDGWHAGYKDAEDESPEGYVLVPVEPTEKMEEAGLEVHPWDYTEDMQKIYKAMIQAAQEEK